MNDHAKRQGSIAAALILLALPGHAAPDTTKPSPDTPAATSPAATPADLTLGNEVVLRLRASAGGMTPQQRVSTVESRLVNVLSTPNIRPSDVVVYLPPKGAPVIYALGRRLITVDTATVRAAGTPGTKPLDVATRWAKRFQQVLPRVNYRPSNAPEPKVPANPPLLVTRDFAKVGGNKGFVVLRGKPILTLHGPQNGGLTAQERADTLSARLERLANKPEVQGPDGVVVKADPAVSKSKAVSDVTVQVAQTPFITVEASEAKFADTTPAKLAAQWAAHIRAVVGTADPNALPAVVAAGTAPPPAAAPDAPAVTAPATPDAPAVTAPATPDAPAVTAPATPDAPAAPAVNTPDAPAAAPAAAPTAPAAAPAAAPTAPAAAPGG